MKNIVLLSLILLCSFLSAGEASDIPNVSTTKAAVFAGGCFWCMQPPFDKLEGVIATKVGYAGGSKEQAKYELVSAGRTQHLEVMQVTYDPGKISYDELLDVFWKNIDPYDDKGQFCDKGRHYTSAVFYGNEEEKSAFEKSRSKLQSEKKLKGEVATKAYPLNGFYRGEEYHQDYYKKNPLRYKLYRLNCGRDARLKEVWGS